MDSHLCKLCSRSFLNGRALGGHMKAHLSFLPPRPTTTTTHHITPPTLSPTASDNDIPTIYSLREKPRKGIKFSDPDCESEAESRDEGCRRKRRSRRIASDDPVSPEAEPVSSVSDTSPEEDVAMCLMMLCRDDAWLNPMKKVKENRADLAATEAQRKVHQCEICKKCFRSSQALGGHRIIHRKKEVIVTKEKIVAANKQKSFRSDRSLNHGRGDESHGIFECPFCWKVFSSGQALGGHKRSHLGGGPGRSSSSSAVVADGRGEKINNNNKSCIDLNLPAPTEDEDVYSVVSDDGGCGMTDRRGISFGCLLQN